VAENKWAKKLAGEFGKVGQELKAFRETVIPMPSPSLNYALGNGGIVEGRAYIFYGPESSGKSLLAQLSVIEILKKYPEGLALVFDAEYAFNKDWFQKLGGDLSRVIVIQSNNPNNIFDYIYSDVYEMIQEGAPVKAIMLDSFRSIIYPKDIKKDSTQLTMGGTGSSYLPSALKRILPVIRECNVTFLGIQQVSDELDIYKKASNPYVLPDGRFLKHFADLLLEITKIENKASAIRDGSTITGSEQQIGHKVRVKVKKNRTAAPAKVAEFTLNYEQGIVNIDQEIFELGVSLGVIKHPLNPNTGKINVQMWQIGENEPIRGEANIREAVRASVGLQREILELCSEENNKSNSDLIKFDEH